MAKKPEAKAVDNRHYDVVLAPHITEKSTMVSEYNAVVFKVANDCVEARDQGRGRGAVQCQRDQGQHDRDQGQDQEVEGSRPTSGRTSKKAIVTLAEGQSIDITSGI